MSAVARLRHWLRLACTVVTLLVLAAPAALGGAMGPVLEQLGDSHAHVCKCGMAVGKCGCPECERAEKQRLSEHRTDSVPTLKRHCDDELPAMALGGALPSGVLAASSATTLPVPRGERSPIVASTPSPSTTNVEPPTPPPRSASV